ncbi:MAG: hypothetical protein ABI759_21365 [Candidatus Solibacter sp.]
MQEHANANTVEITARATDSWLAVTVQDDGRGLQRNRCNRPRKILCNLLLTTRSVPGEGGYSWHRPRRPYG